MCTGAVVYTWAVQLFDTSALIAVARYCPPSGWLTNIQWGLWPLIEWVGALSSLVFLVSRPCTQSLYTSCYILPPALQTCYMLMWSWYTSPEPVYYEEYADEEGGEYEEEQGDDEEEGEDKMVEPETTVE